MNNGIKTIELKESIFKQNDVEADALRKSLIEQGTFLVNVMSSPGSGKTTFLVALINILKSKYKIAVMDADIDSVLDAESVAKQTGVKAIQLHTGGMCHLDAGMTKQGLDGLSDEHYDLVFLENVGNLVCPAEFDTGANLNLNILSVPEGDDKPLKYPLMYQVCDLVIISKIDTLPVFDFSIEKAKENIHFRNKDAHVIAISAKKGDGMDEVADYLTSLIKGGK